MAYPKEEALRVQYWINQIEHTRKKVKPKFDACEALWKQFWNEDSSQREAQSDMDIGGEDHLKRVKAGIVHGWLDQIVSNMVERNPVFRTHPENRESAEKYDPQNPASPSRSSVVSTVLNYYYRELNQLRVDEKATLEANLLPYSVVKIGYTTDQDQVTQDFFWPDAIDAFVDPLEENAFLAIGQHINVDESLDHIHHIDVHNSMLQESLFGMEEEQMEVVEQVVKEHIDMHKTMLNRSDPDANVNVRRGSPFAVNWPSDMFLTDLFCREGLSDARWIAFGWELPIEEVQANPAYKNVSGMEGQRWESAPTKPEGLDSDGFDVVRGWEIWAKNFPMGRGRFRNILCTIVEGHDKFLQYEEEWPYEALDDYPAEVLVFHPGLRSWFEKPPALMGGGDSIQGLVNEVLDSFLSIIRKQKNIWLVDPSSGLNTSKIQDMLEAPDGSVIEIPGLAEVGGNAVLPLPFHVVPGEKNNFINILLGMFDRSMGTPQPVSSSTLETATEAEIENRKNTSRENRRSSILSEFQVRKARKMWQLLTQYLPDKLFLIDPRAQEFVQVTSEVARGEYRFSMDVTSNSTAMAVERSQWMDLLNLFAGLTPLMLETYGLPPNLPEIARRMLVRGFSENTVEEILPMLQATAENFNQGGQQPNISEEGGSGLEFGSPEANMANEAVRDGRAQGEGIGPFDRDTFNRDVPNEGRQAGASQRP